MQMMPIDSIVVDSPYLRTETDVDSLKKSIEMVGLIHPLTINSENKLLAGGRRYTACKELGMTEVAVMVVDRNELEQELISIDENLVRKALTKIEFETCMNRGRDIYEQLNPSAPKVDVEVKELSPEQKRAEKLAEEEDTESFAAVTSEKTGLSKSVIKGAIKRDALSSDLVKDARSMGEISATQANELIRIEKEYQDELLPLIAGRPVKDVRKIIDVVKRDGINAAADFTDSLESLPKEYKDLHVNLKKVNKNFSRILLENIDYRGKDSDKIMREAARLGDYVKDFYSFMGEDDSLVEGLVSSSSFSEMAESVEQISEQ